MNKNVTSHTLLEEKTEVKTEVKTEESTTPPPAMVSPEQTGLTVEEELKNLSNEDRSAVNAFLGRPVDPSQQTALRNAYDKCEVRTSPIEGYGVFATKDIPAGTILEEIPFILWPRYTELGKRQWDMLDKTFDGSFLGEEEKFYEHIRHMFNFKDPEKYYFKWFPPNAQRYQGKYITYSVIPLGFGPIYNTSNTRNNAGWDVKEKTFVFKAEKDIKKDEEVQTFYGYFITENGSTFNCEDVFGFGLDWAEDHAHEPRVFFRVLRFANPEMMKQRQQEPGYRQLAELLGLSNNSLRLRKISVIDDGEEKHPFAFPEQGWSLIQHYMKLKEFRFTRFHNIKFLFSFFDVKDNKEKSSEVIITNHSQKPDG